MLLKKMKKAFLSLSKVARILLGIPATSAFVERILVRQVT
jgi:hypothetical protein